MGIYREYISEDADMQTMLFRYSVMTDVINAKLPEDLKNDIHHLSEDSRKKILKCPYSEQNDRLLFLFGAGILDEDTLKNLILHNDSDFLSDVISAENYVRKCEAEKESNVPNERIQAVILLCANSKFYEDMTEIDFDNAMETALSDHVRVSDKGFIECDRELTDFLNGIGMPFGFFDEENNKIHIEAANYISEGLSEHGDFTYIAPDCKRLAGYVKVFDKLYGRDFIKYSRDVNIPADINFYSEYEHYLYDFKLFFEFKAYPKKRNICGDTVNYFDYSVNDVKNNVLVSSELSTKDDYYDTFKLDITSALDTNELLNKAIRKYKGAHQLLPDMVLEIIHENSSFLYVYKNDKLISVNNTDFRRQLFDFNKIWSIVKKCSAEKQIFKRGDNILIPQEYMDEIPKEQQSYAANLIREQYMLSYSKRHDNSLLKSLNEITAAASEAKIKYEAENNQSSSGNGGNGRKTNSDPKNGNGGK